METIEEWWMISIEATEADDKGLLKMNGTQ